MATFKARHVDHVGTITVERPAEKVLALFSPEGEKRWVEGWRPEYLFRSEDDGPDTTFRTTHGGEETLWMVLDFDDEDGTAGYARITPDSRMGTVMVDVEAIDDTSCWVTIEYELTALTESGNKVLKKFTKKAYREMLAEWERTIATTFRK